MTLVSDQHGRSVVQESLLRFLSGNPQIVEERTFGVSRCISVRKATLNPLSVTQTDKGVIECLPVGSDSCLLRLFGMYQSADGLLEVCMVAFSPQFFEQYPDNAIREVQPFGSNERSEEQFHICARVVELFRLLCNQSAEHGLKWSLRQTSHCASLLERCLENRTPAFTICPVPACRFLDYNSEREKIELAVRLIDGNPGTPFTIKELSRKVAINECYLKKGFKTVTGKTIHEYQQDKRIVRARTLLGEQGMSVTDVAAELGFSSISHFSTAFKRVTGMKPCELLA